MSGIDPSTLRPIVLAHKLEYSPFSRGEHQWRDAQRAEVENAKGSAVHRYVTCSYCGSCSPEELAAAIRSHGVRPEFADFKYGWPHKAYVDLPNEFAGDPEIRSWGSDGAKTSLSGATKYAKFYTTHLQDASEEDRATIEAALGTHFKFGDDGTVRWWPVAPERILEIVSKDRQK